jgi:hypothetical protein
VDALDVASDEDQRERCFRCTVRAFTTLCSRLCNLCHTRKDSILRSSRLHKESHLRGETFMRGDKEFGVQAGWRVDCEPVRPGLDQY